MSFFVPLRGKRSLDPSEQCVAVPQRRRPGIALLLRDQPRDLIADAEKISEGLHVPVEEIRDKVRRYQLAHRLAYEPIIIKDDITPDERAFIESHKDEFPELETIMVHRRLYPKDGFMAHLIGYVGEVSEDMLNSPKFDLYERGDIVGQSGVEQYYNEILMGKNGSRRVLVDSKGREKGKLSEDPAVVKLAASGRRAGAGREERRHRGHGPADGRDLGDGEPSNV